MNWTKIFDKSLEKVLPVRWVVREPGVPIEFGGSYRCWRADYTFTLAGRPYVVEVKLGAKDTALSATKVMAYQKLYNIHTGKNHGALVITRKSNTNSADILACAVLKISILTIDIQKQDEKTARLIAKLDGSVNYHGTVEVDEESAKTEPVSELS
jgi:hypothetical protein